MPAIVKILIVFASVLTLTRVRVHLGCALVLGGMALNVWAGVGAADVVLNTAQSLVDLKLWLLMAVTVIIIELGRFMAEKRNADALVRATERWGGKHGRAATLMALPAMIGLVPMPAGALFSAPFVEQAGRGVEGREAWKAAVNYWFRHIWEYWWPLYPGVIVAMEAFDRVKVEPWQFVVTQICFSPVALLAGYWFLVRPHIRGLAAEAKPVGASSGRALFLTLPLLIVVASVLGLTPLMKAVGLKIPEELIKYVALIIGLSAALVLIVWDDRRAGSRKIFSTLRTKRSLSVLVTLGGVLVFQFLLETSGLLPVASEELKQSGIPLAVVVAALPFLAGMVTGIAVGFTGVSFPLVVGLLAESGGALTPLATLVLAFGCGYMGMLLSPVHLCLLVSKEYFGSTLAGVYRAILPCVVVVILYTLVAHMVLRLAAW